MASVRIVDNSELVSEIKSKIKSNGGYCPCAIVRNNDTKCMCLEFRTMLKEDRIGETCHCGMYEII